MTRFARALLVAAAALVVPIAGASAVDTSPYPWHGDDTIEPLAAVDTLEQRFAPPGGHRRVAVEPGSFGAWLRTLPLAAPGTPVRAFDGRVVRPAGDAHIAAVSTLDVGTRDLQQCADVIMRLHGEWRWHRGELGGLSYPSGGGAIAWARHLAGQVPVADGRSLAWRPGRPKRPTHASFRQYLDVVSAWANTVSLAKHAARPAADAIRPGDFFVLPGAPGHAVLVLDTAGAPDGTRVALIGQSFMPAQSFQVLRPSRAESWFALDPETGLETPYWPRFPWSALRRLDGLNRQPGAAPTR